jgi:hypothetical protein
MNSFVHAPHPGITRCPATQSSDPASAQATPANAAHAIKTGSWGVKDITRRTTAIIATEIEVIAFDEVRSLR